MILAMDRHLSQHLYGKTLSGRVGVLLIPCALKSLNSIEKIQLKMICGSFNGQNCSTIISSNYPTNASDETDIITYNKTSSLVQHILKHNVVIISGNMNADIGKDRNNKFCLYDSPNRNGEYLSNF